jgi:alanine-glyoxylate transaminase / serine-glyoxylate transaminase / serine-pyruvate transaminase
MLSPVTSEAMYPPERILLGPGPSDVSARVLSALARPTVGHLDPCFLDLMDRVRARLRAVFRTANDMTLAASGTGSAGMEMVLTNLIEPGDRVLIGRNGVFGGRMADLAARCGGEVEVVDAPWGEILPDDAMLEAIDRVRPAIVALVHAETSTGVGQPTSAIAQAARHAGALVVLDCVTSLGGMPVEIDEWGIDAAYSGTQKCLSCPPGLSPVTLSERAMDKVRGRKTPVQSWYLDLNLIGNYWGGERAYHHTAPVNMLYALDEALAIVLEEGLEARFARHREAHDMLATGLAELGIGYVSQPGFGLPMLNAVGVPEGTDDAATRRRLLDDYGIEIGGGLGAFKGRAWRIGLMGHAATRRNVALLLAALRDLLARP